MQTSNPIKANVEGMESIRSHKEAKQAREFLPYVKGTRSCDKEFSQLQRSCKACILGGGYIIALYKSHVISYEVIMESST